MSDNRTPIGQVRSVKTKRHGRKGWAIATACFCVLAVFILMAMTTDFATQLFPEASSKGEIQSADTLAVRSGTIVLESGNNRCELSRFDNDSGRTIDDTERCDNNVALDAHGVPIPTGTVHRLDAISKSFFGSAH
jgi:hypothetical protein